MADDDRFRRREHDSAVSQQTPPTAPSPSGADDRALSPEEWHRYAAAQPSPPHYAPPPPVQRYAAPTDPGRDAPLIHPAAAQASSQTPYGVPVYQAPVYAYAPQPQRGLSITALVLGLCSVVFAWTLVVVPIIGIVFGIIALRREPGGRGMAIAGLVTSGLGLLWVLLFYLLPLLGVVGALALGFA